MAEAVAAGSGGPPSGGSSSYSQPLAGGAWLLMIVLVALSNFMEVLDLTIANVSLNTIAGSLAVSITEGTWVITSYSVANAITVPTADWLGRRFGQVKVFAVAVAMFTVASLFCGLSTSLAMLIVGRVIQGAFAGLMVPLSQALMLNNSPPHLRTMALAAWAMTITVAPVIGPLIGGWIADNYHWSWIFLINIPAGVLASVGVWQLMKNRETPIAKMPIDAVGLALVVLWVGALQIMLDKGNELDWFGNKTIIGLAIVGIVGFVFFMAWELTDEHPLVDLGLFRYRNFTAAMIAMAFGFCIYLANVVLLPIVYQSTLGYNATWSGRLLAPSGLLAILLSPVVGRFMGKGDPRIYATGGFVVFAICSYWRTFFTTTSSAFDLVLPQVLQGAGVAMFFAPLVSIMTGGIPPQRMANASSFQTFGRMMMASFGTSLIVTLWDRRAALHRTQLVEALPAAGSRIGDAMTSLHQAGLSDMFAYGEISHQVDAQAQMLAANDMFLASAVVYLLAMTAIWFARPPFGGGGGGH